MWPPPLLAERTPRERLIFAIIVPALFGALTGYILGVSKPAYVVLSIVAAVGGVGAGFDHLGANEGTRRGIFGGVIFGASILIAHEIHGEAAKVALPHPGILLIVVTAVFGGIFGALGGFLRARSTPAA